MLLGLLVSVSVGQNTPRFLSDTSETLFPVLTAIDSWATTRNWGRRTRYAAKFAEKSQKP